MLSQLICVIIILHILMSKMKESFMYIVVGLGNPGKRFEGTRHNVGFEAIDLLAHRHDIKVDKIKHKALIGEGFIGTEKVMLVKPQTFMNLSGESVMKICEYHKVDISRLIVVFDDVDTDFGKIRIRKKGSAGTHNGMRNIIYLLQKDEFPRVRIGIGKSERIPLADFVLQRFNVSEGKEIAQSIEKAADAVRTIVLEGADRAMNLYNG